jgi:hypothetical protein
MIAKSRIAIRTTRPDNAVEAWNSKYPVRTLVEVTRDNGIVEETRTTSEAWVVRGHSAVVKLVGIAACYSLNRVRPVPSNK